MAIREIAHGKCAVQKVDKPQSSFWKNTMNELVVIKVFSAKILHCKYGVLMYHAYSLHLLYPQLGQRLQPS